MFQTPVEVGSELGSQKTITREAENFTDRSLRALEDFQDLEMRHGSVPDKLSGN
jgi:hypothetical protein